jgi:hypothetical protein
MSAVAYNHIEFILSMWRQGMENRQGKYWYVLDIILIILVLFYVIPNVPFRLKWYVSGLFNLFSMYSFMLAIDLLLFVPATFCVFVLGIRIFFSWPKHINDKRKLLFLRLCVITGLIVIFGLLFKPIKKPVINIYMDGFTKHVKANADIKAIRLWLDTINREFFVKDNTISASIDIQRQEWPECVVGLYPGSVRLLLDDNGHPQVWFVWADHWLGVWGFVVGKEDFLFPLSDISSLREYRKELCKGVYLFYDD